jgi:hypothetical protein
MLVWIVMLLTLASAPSAARSRFPIFAAFGKARANPSYLDGGYTHHSATQQNEPQLRSVSFTLTVERQEGRRFFVTFSSARGSERVIAVSSRSGAILLADNDGHTHGTMLAPNRMELCHLHVAPTVRIASCVELIKQP